MCDKEERDNSKKPKTLYKEINLIIGDKTLHNDKIML